MTRCHPVAGDQAAQAAVDEERYRSSRARPLADINGFWRDEAERLDRIASFATVRETSFGRADFYARRFADGVRDVPANRLDRHPAERRSCATGFRLVRLPIAGGKTCDGLGVGMLDNRIDDTARRCPMAMAGRSPARARD